MTVDGNVFKLQPGQSIMIKPGSLRSPAAASRKPPEYMFIFLDDVGMGLADFSNRLLTADDETWQAILKLKRESMNPRDSMSRLYCENMAVNIFIALFRGCEIGEERVSHAGGRHHELVQRLDMFMRTKLSEPVNRKKLAEFVHMSPPHLARIFHSETGMTPLEYLTKIRIERAKTLLTKSSLSVTQIALNVGYESISHFSQLFHKATGLAPLKYRYRHGEK
jgi:AraC-like DNA-binding protein